MKIVHTADLHLFEIGDPRWEALEKIVGLCREEDVSVLTISGDLFDSNADADTLRPHIREVFDRAAFDTLVIPGNHDSKAFTEGLYFGERIHLLSDSDWSRNVFDLENVRIIGVPFEALDAYSFRARLRELRSLFEAKASNVLLYHGELLDASFDRKDLGPGEEARYMPSRLVFFQELPVAYVLAGHFHTSFDLRSLGSGRFFVYPGSPASVTRREVGKRSIGLIEVGAEPVGVPLETHHFERVELTLDAFMEEDPLEVVRLALRDIDKAATVLLTVGGTVRAAEAEVVESINSLTTSMQIEPDFRFKDVSKIVSHPVFELFERKLAETRHLEGGGIEETKAHRLREMAIRAMVEADL